MSPSDHEALVRRLYAEGINRRDAVAAAAFYAEDAINHGNVVGRTGMRRVYESLFSTFPDVHYEMLQVTAAEDRVVCLTRMSGTHRGRPTSAKMYQGMLAEVAPTGRAVRVLQYHGFRLRDGSIAEHEAVRDDLGMLLQLGVVARAE